VLGKIDIVFLEQAPLGQKLGWRDLFHDTIVGLPQRGLL
jgi:hypothetical protein